MAELASFFFVSGGYREPKKNWKRNVNIQQIDSEVDFIFFFR